MFTALLTAKEMDAVIFSLDEDFKKEGAKVLPEGVEQYYVKVWIIYSSA